MATELNDFVTTMTIKSPAASVPVKSLWQAFRKWLGDQARGWRRKDFLQQLKTIGVRIAHEHGRDVAVGIGLLMLVADGRIYRIA